jgi:dihydrofolate reductase
MAKLIYSGIMSLDGYVADEDGTFDWSAPNPEVHEFVNDLERPIGTYLYGRRMYEVMAYWETGPGDSDPDHIREYGEIWRSADKIVYSSTLQQVSTARTRIERAFDPEAVRELKATNVRDISIGGPSWPARPSKRG